jgi:hypothetical protein
MRARKSAIRPTHADAKAKATVGGQNAAGKKKG